LWGTTVTICFGEGGKLQTMSSARRMRKNLSLLILLPFLITSPLTFLVLPSFSQTIPVQGSFSDLTLELTAPKQNLVQLEPLPLILTLRNKTAYSIISQTTLDFAAGRVQLFIIEDNREPVRIKNISPIAKFVVVDPGPIRPGERRETKELLTIALDKVFPQPGSYQIQAVLRDDREKRQIKSRGTTPSVKSTEAPLGAENTQGLGDKVYKGLGQKVPTQETTLQEKFNNNVNVRHLKNKEGDEAGDQISNLDGLARAMILAQDMLEVFGDRKSRDFYSYVSLKLLDYEHDIRFLLASFKQDIVNNPRSTVKNPAALFVVKLKGFALEKGIEL
jgi:hypothetical protein